MEPPRQRDDGERETRATKNVEHNPPLNNNTIPPVTRSDPPELRYEEETQPPPQFSPDASFNNTANTGWSAMAHNVREVDEQKVRDHKEDIDTILVFAGLFSAVMTAFLVESYHNLSPDPTNVMIMLMQQVASQTHSYSINDGFVNSTAAPLPPTLPDFHPTVNAVRVNVLWFASLTLSLVSASFSILVKQWLREFLAGDYTSPQARLRIRHFRYPGLEHWKVFEIAATIPLLLQVSLALFLVGLCFFTADVHDTVGHTTLPLVAGWAVLFVAVSFAPIFSPRCPYKTTVFMSVLTAVRNRIYHFFVWAKGLEPPRTQMNLFACLSDRWSFNDLAYDEEVVMKDGSHDVDILIAVDSIQNDDHLLLSMWEAVRQTIPGPADSLGFIRKIIEHRIQRDIFSDSVSTSTDYLDLTKLPKRTAASVFSMVNDILKEDFMQQLDDSLQSESNTSQPPWMKNFLRILLSKTDSSRPSTIDKTLSLLVSDNSRCSALFEAIVSQMPNRATLPYVLERFRGVLSQQRSSLLTTLKIIMEAYFCADHSTHGAHPSCFPLSLENHPEIRPTHLQPLVSIIVSASLKQFDFRPEAVFLAWQAKRLEFILGLPNHHLYHDDVMKFVKSLLLGYSASVFCKHASGLYWRLDWKYRSYAQDLFIEAIVGGELHESEEIIKEVIRDLYDQWNQQKESEDPPWRREYRLDPLKTYHMVLRALKKATEVKGRASLEPHWTLVRTQLWPSVENGMEIVAARLGLYEGHPKIARSCLELIDTFDLSSTPDYEDNDAFLTWADNFDENESLVPDACIRMLGRFLPRAVDVRSYRLRRTRRMDARMDVETPEVWSYEASRAHSHDEDSSRMESSKPADVNYYKVDKFHRMSQT